MASNYVYDIAPPKATKMDPSSWSITSWPVLLMGGLTTAVFSLWNQVKSWGSRVLSHVIVTEYCDAELGQMVIGKLNERYKRSPFGEHYYGISWVFVRPLERERMIAYLKLGASLQLFWKGKWPIWTNGQGQAKRKPVDGRAPKADSSNEYPYSISYIRGTFNWKQFVQECLDEEDALRQQHRNGSRYEILRIQGRARKKRQTTAGYEVEAPKTDSGYDEAQNSNWNRFQDLVPLHYTHDDLGVRQSREALSLLSINKDLEAIVEEIRFWRKSEKWYKTRGIPWRRGYLFWGIPGTGKTSMARALAEELDLPVYMMDIASMENRDLIEAWTKIRQNQPCMVLFEDFDNVFHGRENVSDVENGVTFDCFLNCIDGIEQASGTLLVFTSNILEQLDAALYQETKSDSDIASRPGRVDRAVEFKHLDEAGRRKMALRIVTDQMIAEELVIKGTKDTAAQFQERCFQRALAELFKSWKGSE